MTHHHSLEHKFAWWQSAIVAVGLALAVNIILMLILQKMVQPFGPLSVGYVAKYTVIGAVAAAVAYAILYAITKRVNIIFTTGALVVLIFSYIPDFQFLKRGAMPHLLPNWMQPRRSMPAGGMPRMMPMHNIGGIRMMMHATTHGDVAALLTLHTVAAIVIVYTLVFLTKKRTGMRF